jgi:transposase
MEEFGMDVPMLLELLGLEDVKITQVKIRSDKTLLIRVKSTKAEISCHRCGRLTKPYGYGRTLELRHLSIFGKKTFIEITPPRGICEFCDDHPTTTQTLSWFERNAHHTKDYEKAILLSLIHSTITDVSIKEELSESTIQRIIDKRIDAKTEWKSIKKLGIIGIDEISLKKGYRDFITIITSRVDDTIRVLGLIKGREKSEIKAFLKGIPKKQRKTIVAFCTDMYDGFINAAKEIFGEAIPVIVDRFHIAKLYRKSLVSLRKKELARLKKELSAEEYHSLQGAIKILIKKNEKYSRDERVILESLFNYSTALKAAYRLTRQLTSIFNTHHRKNTAIRKINEWIEKVEESDVNCFHGFIKTFMKYEDEVTNYFIDRQTSGFIEGLNNKIKVIKRRCYGILNLKNFFQRIFLDLQGYQFFNTNQQLGSGC